MKVLVAIAAYNEARNLGPVIDAIKGAYDVVVVDDGSSDATSDAARAHGAAVVRHPINLGQGPAIITAFKVAIAGSYDILITMDGDGQHNPDEIPHFIEFLEENDVDYVTGSRVLGEKYGNMSFMRKTFLPFFTGMINKASGYSISDSMCGFRAFRVPQLRKMIPQLENMFEPQYISPEIFIRFGRAGLRVGEIPVKLRERTFGVSHKGMFRFGLGVSKAIIKTFLDKSRRHGHA